MDVLISVTACGDSATSAAAIQPFFAGVYSQGARCSDTGAEIIAAEADCVAAAAASVPFMAVSSA